MRIALRKSGQQFGENFGTQCLSFYWVFMGNSEIQLNIKSYKGDPPVDNGNLFGAVYKLDMPEWRFTQVEITEKDAFEVRYHSI